MAGGWSKTQESEATRRRSLVLSNLVDPSVVIDPADQPEAERIRTGKPRSNRLTPAQRSAARFDEQVGRTRTRRKPPPPKADATPSFEFIKGGDCAVCDKPFKRGARIRATGDTLCVSCWSQGADR